MTVPKPTPPARLVTVFGTALYVDAASGELRHGEADSVPANAVLTADQNAPGPRRYGRLMCELAGIRAPIVCMADRCKATHSGDDDSPAATLLELVPLERGLVALSADGRFLSAEPTGSVALSRSVCSTWECFLASEDWCGDSDWRIADIAGAAFDFPRIREYIVHPLIRMRSGANSSALKVLIYGYTKWSHGRVYYDLCKQFHRKGYIVDILDWQANHVSYFDQLSSYYDLFITALDGVRALVDTYGAPFDRIIALSHHEFDIRMLIEQMGIGVFDKFASYGVVSESLYSASLMMGVTRPPLVVPLGVNYSDFYTEVPERLATVGYAGSMSAKTYGVEWKRGELAEAAALDAGLAFKVAGSTGKQISIHDMPDFYKSVDAVVASSVSEGAGLPFMEGAAAGRLVIGTPVGHFPLKAYQGAGIIAPIEPEKFKGFTAAILRHYKDNPAAYVDRCNAIQEAARIFDWQYMIGEWIALIECAAPDGGRATRRAATAESNVRLAEALKPRQPLQLGGAGVATETQKIFSQIYRQRGFGGTESRSGPGSGVEKTAKLRAELPGVLGSLGIRRLVDAPCGDMNWMQHLDYKFDFFVGVDIVDELIEVLRVQMSSASVHFQRGDICEDILPAADAILCRDCLVHLPYSKITNAVRLFRRSGAKFLLTTTYPDHDNRDVTMGDWRRLNLQAGPFWWPEPITLIREDFPEDTDPWNKNKSIGFWELASIPDLELDSSEGQGK